MFKSGFIAIAGRPNVGKSTLLNAILGEKIAITSSKPQTTRNRITGILNADDGQFIFLDTPGIHRAKTPLNRYMVKAATSTFSEVDLILFLIEADRGHDSGRRSHHREPAGGGGPRIPRHQQDRPGGQTDAAAPDRPLPRPL